MSFCRVSAIVDDVYMEHSHVAGTFTMLASSRAHVGGSLNARALPGARVHNNFIGCLKKVEFSADTLRLNLIDLARTGSKLITVTGRLDYACTAVDHADPVTFATRDAHLVQHSSKAYTTANPVKRQYTAYIGFRIVSDGSRHENHHHRYGKYHMGFRNHYQNSRRPVHNVVPKADDERNPPLKLVVINIPVTFKPDTRANPTDKLNHTRKYSGFWKKTTHKIAVKKTNHEVTPNSTRVKAISTITKSLINDRDLVTPRTPTPVRHHHRDEPDLDDYFLHRAIKISMPVIFKEPIPTHASKKIDHDYTEDKTIKKNDQDKPKSELNDKKKGEINTSVVIKIVASNYTVSYNNPKQIQAIIHDEERKAFELRKEAALKAARARNAKQRGNAVTRGDTNKSYLLSIFSKNSTVPIITKKAEMAQNSTY